MIVSFWQPNDFFLICRIQLCTGSSDPFVICFFFYLHWTFERRATAITWASVFCRLSPYFCKNNSLCYFFAAKLLFLEQWEKFGFCGYDTYIGWMITWAVRYDNTFPCPTCPTCPQIWISNWRADEGGGGGGGGCRFSKRGVGDGNNILKQEYVRLMCHWRVWVNENT